MSKYRLSKALGEIDEELLEEVLEYDKECERRRIVMNRKKLALVIVATVAVTGIMAVTAFSKEPDFRSGTNVFDPAVTSQDPVIIHDSSDLDDLLPGTPFVIAPDSDIETESVLPIQSGDYEKTIPEITDVVVKGSSVTIYWIDQNENETKWEIGLCVNTAENRILKTVGETGETQYLIEGLEAGEYLLTVVGTTPDEGDPTKSIRVSTAVIFTIE